MLVIRLFRTGKKNQPSYKIVVTDKTKPTKAGRFLEMVGFYNSLSKKRDLKGDRIKYWMSVGAKPSDTVYNLLVSEKIIEGKKIPSHNKLEKKEEAPAAATAAPVAPAPPSAETPVEKPETPAPAVEVPVEPVPAEAPKIETPVDQPKEEAPVVEEKPVEEAPAENK